MELWDAPIQTIVLAWWPFVIYAGWVTVATIANIAVLLKSTRWDGFGISEVTWTLIMICIALAINLLAVINRNLREFAAVGIWAFVGIGVANFSTEILVAQVSFVAAAILFLAISIHGYKNRATNPMIKLKQFIDGNHD